MISQSFIVSYSNLCIRICIHTRQWSVGTHCFSIWNLQLCSRVVQFTTVRSILQVGFVRMS